MKLQLATVVVSVLLAGADKAGPGQSDRENFQGTWNVVSMTHAGKPVAADNFKGAQLIFEGNHFGLRGGKETFRGTFKLHPDHNPKQIDVTFHDLDNREKGKAKGIYKRDGNRLTICLAVKGGERPHQFTSSADNRLLVAEYVRPR